MKTEEPTWETLTAIEPRLLALERRCAAVRECAMDNWFGWSEAAAAPWEDDGIPWEILPDGSRIVCLANVPYRDWNEGRHFGLKSDMERLVGWHVSRDANPALRTQAAYNVAYRHLWALVALKGGPRQFTAAQKRALFAAADGRCQLCGVDLAEGWHADHREPWAKGGVTTLANGVALCPSCNLLKRAMQVNPTSAYGVLKALLDDEQRAVLADQLKEDRP